MFDVLYYACDVFCVLRHEAGTILEKMLFSANHSVGTYHVVIFVVKVANMR